MPEQLKSPEEWLNEGLADAPESQTERMAWIRRIQTNAIKACAGDCISRAKKYAKEGEYIQGAALEIESHRLLCLLPESN
jgi:hypothetical protein